MIVYSALRLRRYFVFGDPVALRKQYRELRRTHSRQNARFEFTAGAMPDARRIH